MDAAEPGDARMDFIPNRGERPLESLMHPAARRGRSHIVSRMTENRMRCLRLGPEIMLVRQPDVQVGQAVQRVVHFRSPERQNRKLMVGGEVSLRPVSRPVADPLHAGEP